jgi:hypothetical protein
VESTADWLYLFFFQDKDTVLHVMDSTSLVSSVDIAGPTRMETDDCSTSALVDHDYCCRTRKPTKTDAERISFLEKELQSARNEVARLLKSVGGLEEKLLSLSTAPCPNCVFNRQCHELLAAQLFSLSVATAL